MGVEKTSGGQDVCANSRVSVCGSSVGKGRKRKIISVVEGQVAMPDYLQSSLYVNNCVLRRLG